jgi:hypothetical protein
MTTKNEPKKDVKKRKTYELRLTKFELLHLRDVLSVALPPDAKKTLSQALAELENRLLVESTLWNKLVDACEEADLPVGDEAPDYVIAPNAPPSLSVFQLASEPPGDDDEEGEKVGGGLSFIKSSATDKDSEED